MLAKSSRLVISEEEILAQACTKCNAQPSFGCLSKSRYPLAYALNSTELAFHRERTFSAINEQQAQKFAGLSIPDRNAVEHFAFILLCDSVAAKSTELLGKEFTSLDIQKFFAHKAVAELKRDNLLG